GGEVAEIAVLAVFLLIPIVGEFDQRRAASLGGFQQALVFGGAQEHQGVFRLVVVDAADFLQSQRIPVEFQRVVEVAHAQHGVEIAYVSCLPGYIEEIGFEFKISIAANEEQVQ